MCASTFVKLTKKFHLQLFGSTLTTIMGTAELPRITGTEFETCIGLVRSDGSFKFPLEREPYSMLEYLPDYLGRLKSSSGSSSNHFLTNGARIYVDVGNHIEYATPEDSSLWGTVANELALETVLSDTIKAYGTVNPGSMPVLHKRVVDAGGNTWGYHENYHMPNATRIPTELELTSILAHLATRQIFTGAGFIKPGTGKYYVSQKMTQVYSNLSAATQTSKPLVNTRDERHTGTNKNQGRRLHIVSGDVNMSPWATFMKLATTSMVLRLIEEGAVKPNSLLARQPFYEVARIFCGDVSLRQTVEMQDGSKATAINIQQMLFEQVQDYAGRRGLPEEEFKALGMWEDILQQLHEQPDSRNSNIDWMAKYAVIQQYAEHKKLSSNDPIRESLDWQWDFIDPLIDPNIKPRGFGQKLRKNERRWGKWVDDDLVTERTSKPPSETRAHPRSLFIERVCNEKQSSTTGVGWDFIKYDGREFKLANPRSSSTALVERMFMDQALILGPTAVLASA